MFPASLLDFFENNMFETSEGFFLIISEYIVPILTEYILVHNIKQFCPAFPAEEVSTIKFLNLLACVFNE